VTFMDSFGRDPNPGYHDVHYMSRPDFKKDVDSRNAYPEESFAQRPQSLVQKENGRKYYLDGDDTGDAWVKCPGGYPPYHDVHAMARPDYKSSVYHCGPWSDVYTPPKHWGSLAQRDDFGWVTDDSADRWVHWPRTGKDPNPGYHDVHFMTRPDFNITTLQWPRSFAQTESQDDYKYDDWTGDRWVKYPHGREPFPPPHDPEWYRKEDFWHSVYQPIKPAKSFVQESVEEPADDYKYDDWTGDRWVKYPQGREPFPPPHDPEWYKKEDFWHSIYQPVKPAKQ